MVSSERFTHRVDLQEGLMKEVAQTVLPFPVAATEESMTAHSGLLLFGEFALGQ